MGGKATWFEDGGRLREMITGDMVKGGGEAMMWGRGWRDSIGRDGRRIILWKRAVMEL
jgi:hypothetical protein